MLSFPKLQGILWPLFSSASRQLLIYILCISCGKSSFAVDLKPKYSKAESNIMELKRLGATVLHGVDAKQMRFHTDLKNSRFDRIVFNFPHGGFKGKEDGMHMIKYGHYFIMLFVS